MSTQNLYSDSLREMLEQREKISLEEMKSFLSKLKCPNDKIDPIINGIIVDLIMGKLLPSGSPFNLLLQQIKEVVTNITREHLNDILEYMASKGWVRIKKESDKIFKIKAPLPNCEINI